MRSPADRDDGRAATSAIAIAILGLLALQFFQAFTTTPLLEAPGNGTPWAPHSDALGPWLDGGLAYLFGLKVPLYIYRPTVGLFWGSVLSAAGHIEAVPMLFLLWLFLAAALVTLFSRDVALRSAFLVSIAFAAIRFPQTGMYLGFDIDLAALAITFTGVLLVLWDRGPGSRLALLVGCTCLGIGAAIRGPLMIAGPLAIGIRVLLMERAPWAVVAAAFALWLAPIGIDIALQRHIGVANNGIQALFCVYSDPSHGWTPACKNTYHALDPSGSEVVRNFLAFRASAEGLQLLHDQVTWRVGRDLRLVYSPGTLALILAMAALATGDRRPTSASLTPFVRTLFVVATLFIVWQSVGQHPGAPFAWLVLATAFAAVTRQWRALFCLTCYAGGILFIALTGMIGQERHVATFAFTLVLGSVLVGTDSSSRPTEAPGRPWARQALTVGSAAMVLFLYSGSAVLKSELRETYMRDVYQRPNVSMKIGNDPRIDRSLYYSGSRQLIYTRYDTLPVGAVRKYRKLASDSAFNASFVRPNAFVD